MRRANVKFTCEWYFKCVVQNIYQQIVPLCFRRNHQQAPCPVARPLAPSGCQRQLTGGGVTRCCPPFPHCCQSSRCYTSVKPLIKGYRREIKATLPKMSFASRTRVSTAIVCTAIKTGTKLTCETIQCQRTHLRYTQFADLLLERTKADGLPTQITTICFLLSSMAALHISCQRTAYATSFESHTSPQQRH